MRMLSILVLACAGMAWAGDQTVGGGGDALRQKLFEARRNVSRKMSALKPCSFGPEVPKCDVDLILAKKDSMIADISTAEHKWVVDAQTTCGWTNFDQSSAIYFSYPTCGNTVHEQSDADFVLAHESFHRIGIRDENKADALARAVLNAREIDRCPDTGTIWEESWCPDTNMTRAEALTFFKPAESYARLGQVYINLRYRNCAKLTGCANWNEFPVTEISDSGTNYATADFGFLNLYATDHISFYINSLDNIHHHLMSRDGEFESGKATMKAFVYAYTGSSSGYERPLGYANYGTHQSPGWISIQNGLNGKLGKSCAWFKTYGRLDTSNSTWYESELVMTSRY